MKILILASNPRRDLNLDDEIRDLKDAIERSANRQQFEVEHAPAVRVGDLQDLLFKHRPQIVHFCGHGSGKQGLVFKGSDCGEQWVRAEALSDMFRLFSRKINISCVLLNACYSEEQANAIVNHIDYVIGMSQEIRDDAAIAFSKGFYRALGYECSVEQAYEFGKNAIQLEISGSSKKMRSAATDESRKAEVVDAIQQIRIPEHLKPILKIKPTLVSSLRANITAPVQPISQETRVAIQLDIDKSLEENAKVKQYRDRVREFLADRKLTPLETIRLERLRKDLGLSEAEAKRILEEEQEPIRKAREEYEAMLIELIEAGNYPLDAGTEKELQSVQQELGLSDEEATAIATPILTMAEEDYQARVEQENQQEYQQKLQRYEQEFSQAIAAQYLVNEQKNQEDCKSTLENLGSQLSTILSSSMTDLSDEWGKYLEQFVSSRLKILFLGEFKRGKSALINAILGTKILPSYSTPCTNVPTEVKWGEHPQAILHYLKSEENSHPQPMQIDYNSIEDYIVIPEEWDENYINPYEKAEIFYPSKLCEFGIEIVDTPGLNEEQTRSQIINNYLPVIDLFVFVFTCEALASQSEIRFIEDLRRFDVKDIFFVCNNFDRIRSQEKNEVVEYAMSKLLPLTQLGEREIFFVSAANALEGHLAGDSERILKSGILDFEKEINKFCLRTNRLKLSSFASKLEMFISSAKERISKRHEIMKQTKILVEEASFEFQQLRQNIEATELQLNQIYEQLREVCKSKL